MTRIQIKATELRRELGAIAGDELGDVLDSWDDGLSVNQLERLARYLSSELGPDGLLALEQLDRPEGAAIRRQARIVLKAGVRFTA